MGRKKIYDGLPLKVAMTEKMRYGLSELADRDEVAESELVRKAVRHFLRIRNSEY